MDERRDLEAGEASRDEGAPVKEISKGERERFLLDTGSVSLEEPGDVGVKGREIYGSDLARIRPRRPVSMSVQ